MTSLEKLKYLKWIGLLIYPFFVFSTLPQLSAQDRLDQAYKHVLNLQFDEARILTQSSSTEQIPFFKLYIENLSDILELFFSENDSLYDVLSRNERSRLKILGRSEYENPYILFFQSEIKMQWAFIKLKFGKQWSAAWSLRNAYKTMRRNVKKYPEFALNQKSIGLLHVIFGAVPEKHQWLLGLFGLEGDVMLGLEELDVLTVDHQNVFNTEARLISSLVNSYLLEDEINARKNLNVGEDHSLIEAYITALVLMKANSALEARSILLDAKSDQPLFDYLIAETFFQEGLYRKANEYYQQFLDEFKGINNIKDAHFKSSLCYLFQGDLERFNSEKQKAQQFGQDYSEVDKNAANLVANDVISNQLLIKLRYAIDGGFYQKADTLITELRSSQLSHYDLIELNYRNARLSHLQGKLDQAIIEYAKIFRSDNLIPENYFAPNSLLQLGYIYMGRDEPDKATMYLERVLKFRKHPYKNSLDSKAKIALEKIRN